jgi:hypothetical protein
MTPQTSPGARGTGAERRFGWIAAGFGALVVGGFVIVLWAIVNGEARDVAASPFHLPFYAGVGLLVLLCAASVVGAMRRGLGWRHAMPDGYGILGVGAVTLLAALVLDVAWREGVGIAGGIEEGFAPSRIVLVVGLGMVAIAPLRAALLIGASRVPRVAVLLSTALTLVAIGWPGGLHPAETPWLAVDPRIPEIRADLWIMDADGTHQTRLLEAEPETNLGYASRSPDGARIAYTLFGVGSGSVATGDASLWTVAADGSDPRAIGTSSEWRWIPRITADGGSVLFTQEAPGGPWMDAGPVGPGAAVGPQGPLSIPLPDADIWRIAASGDGAAEPVSESAGDDRAPVPSPDGSLILFDSTRDGNTELYVMDADGTHHRRLTDDPGEDWGGSWSPDGTRIAFNSTRSGDLEIFVMDADGTNVRQVTFDRGVNSSPTWSPDGARIAYTARGENDYGQIWSIAADGGDARNLSRSPSSNDQVWTGGWGVDGRIAFTRSLAPVPFATPLARLDLGVAGMVLSMALTAAVVVLLARTSPPPGSFTLALTLATALIAAPSGEWRFVAAGLLAGLAADAAAWLARPPLRARSAAAAAAAAFVLAAGALSLATGGLEWTPTLVLGVALACGLIGWGIGTLGEGPAGQEAASPP